MHPFRIFLSAILSASILASPIAFAAAPTPETIIGAGAVLMDQTTGQMLFDKSGSVPMFPASTTKVLTALIILEDTPLTDLVTIDARTPFTDGSRIYLIEGEQVTVEQLLYAMLLPSANDAAVALAKYHSGTLEAFSQVMNQRAKSLGATHSVFQNPSGLPDPKHVTSARDLALIAGKAMENPTFRKIVSTTAYDLPPTNKQPEVRHLHNGNRLLFGTGWRNRIVINNQNLDIKWELADGIKTGYTTAARQCIISSASRDGRRVIAVILKSEGKDIYKDARILLQHGLDDYKNAVVVKKDQPLGDMSFGDDDLQIPVYAAEDKSATLPANTELGATEPRLVPKEALALPIEDGQIVGSAVYTLPDQLTVTVPVKAASDMTDSILPQGVFNLFSGMLPVFGYAIKALGAVILLFFLWRCSVTWKRLQKRKRLQQLKGRAERERSL